MKFQKGRARTGGRKAGVKYSSIKRDVTEMLDAMGCNPFEGMAKIAINTRAPLNIRAHCHAQLAKYLKPQLKSVEVSGAGGGPVQFDIASVRAFIKQANKDGE